MQSNFGRAELVKARRASGNLFRTVFLFSIFVNILMLTGPLFMLLVYDRVLASGSEATLVALFSLVAALYALMGLLEYARGRIMARAGARFQSSLDARVFKASLSRGFDGGASHATALRDLETIQSFFGAPVFLALCDVPWSPLFFAAIFVFHPLLGWLGITGGALLIIITILNQIFTRKRQADANRASTHAQIQADEARRGGEVILSQGMETAMLARWLKTRNGSLSSTIGANDLNGIFTSSTKALRLFLQSAMLALGAYLVLQNEVTAGAMIAGSIILGRALQPVEQILGGWSLAQKTFTAWRSISKTLAETPEAPQKLGLTRPEARLDVAGLTVFPPKSDIAILRQVTFLLEPGQALGVIGKSGSGKSTLARALTGLVPPNTGDVRLGGATLEQYDRETFGKLVGYLPQSVTLFDGTIAENIARMDIDFEDVNVEAAAKQANAHDLITSLPQGYNTQISGAGSILSGGQKQRIALARAFYGDPVMLILDEPNSALDAEGTEALNLAVESFKSEDKIVIIMTHRPMAIAPCDTIMVVEAGMVRAFGPKDEVLRANVKNANEMNAVKSGKGAA